MDYYSGPPMENYSGVDTVANRHVDVLRREINMMHRGRDSEIDLGMHFGEPPEPMNEPIGSEVW